MPPRFAVAPGSDLRLYRSSHDEIPLPSRCRYRLTFGVTAAVAAPSQFEEGVFVELNRFRSDPAAYAEYLRDYRPRFEGMFCWSATDDSEIDIMTREGVAAVDEVIRDLRREKPLPELEWSDAQARAAADHVAVQSRTGAVGH